MDQVLDPVYGAHLQNDADIDAYFMARALALAWRAAGRTEPNPLVGAVVVRDGQVVGEGFHETCGRPHAEVVALERAGAAAKGATLYSTLEPCAHHGRTPPCVDAIVRFGIRRVVVATLDPDPRVNGKGIEFLRAQGIDVTLSCSAEAALVVNLAYFKRTLGLGIAVSLKMATTLDGRIASLPNRRDEITGSDTQRFVHELRACHDAVAVGVGTVVVDQPRLDCRLLDGVRDPLPVVFDSNARMPMDNRWSRDGRKFYVAAMGEQPEVVNGTSGQIVACEGRDGRVCVVAAVERLHREQIHSLLVEGGAQLFSSFVSADAWDVMHIIVAPKLFGSQGVPLVEAGLTAALDAVPVDAKRLGDDYRITYFRNEMLGHLLKKLT